jgi:hypothetical protein
MYPPYSQRPVDPQGSYAHHHQSMVCVAYWLMSSIAAAALSFVASTHDLDLSRCPLLLVANFSAFPLEHLLHPQHPPLFTLHTETSISYNQVLIRSLRRLVLVELDPL